MPYEPPTHSVERSMRATMGVRTVAGVDEVGRGAWAGPVTVCAAITGLRRPPEGLTDSKLIAPKRRTEMAAVLTGWVTSYALGHASNEEIDQFGMTAALRMAASRALEALPERPEAVILERGNSGEGLLPVSCLGLAMAVGRVLEVRIPFDCLRLATGDSVAFIVAVHRGAQEIEHHPRHRAIEFTVPDRQFASANWTA